MGYVILCVVCFYIMAPLAIWIFDPNSSLNRPRRPRSPRERVWALVWAVGCLGFLSFFGLLCGGVIEQRPILWLAFPVSLGCLMATDRFAPKVSEEPFLAPVNDPTQDDRNRRWRAAQREAWEGLTRRIDTLPRDRS